MNNDYPDVDEKAWLKLYDAAVAFKELQPWKWMYDSDIFGVKNPLTGEIGFCCVMGNLREVFALAVYQGNAGLKSYRRLATCQEAPEDSDTPFEQDCIMASFEDKYHLLKEDKEIIKNLGLKYDGRNAWPTFRRYLPGRMPWFLKPAEIEFLTLVLEQASLVCRRIKEDRELLMEEQQNTYLIRVPQDTSQGAVWRDERVTVADPLEEEEHFNIFLDEDRLKRIKEKLPRREVVWEADLFLSPGAITDKTPPYFPRMFLCCDQASGYVLGSQVFAPENYHEAFASYFLDLIKAVEFFPSMVRVSRDVVYGLLYPILSGLGVELEKTSSLPMAKEARKSWTTYIKREKIGRNYPCPCGSGKKYKKCCGNK